MMNKFFLTFFLCLSGFAVSAQHTAKISYSGGLINKESGFLIKGRGQAEAAIYLPGRFVVGRSRGIHHTKERGDATCLGPLVTNRGKFGRRADYVKRRPNHYSRT